ncbi:hypothetical protein J437_LFUL019637, partial [Ladona fulva]
MFIKNRNIPRPGVTDEYGTVPSQCLSSIEYLSLTNTNRFFPPGITGNVTIDANGDRIADYTLLDMDPDTFTFKEVAHYEGATGTLVDVPGAVIHWAGGRTKAPPDTPLCGFDNSLCPDN